MVRPRLSIGPSDFAALRAPGVLFVDKSGLIERVINDSYQTLLLPRPRRFGKTTNLSMLGYFLGQSAQDHSSLFQDLTIWRSVEARRHFQRYPLIKLTLKDIKEPTWSACLAKSAGVLAALFDQHAEALSRASLTAPTSRRPRGARGRRRADAQRAVVVSMACRMM